MRNAIYEAVWGRMASGAAIGNRGRAEYHSAAGYQPASHSGKPQTVLAVLHGRGGRVQGRQAD
jgi:hypothetical protein